jgi:hypothetical protein
VESATEDEEAPELGEIGDGWCTARAVGLGGANFMLVRVVDERLCCDIAYKPEGGILMD